MKIKIVSDGKASGTRVVDADTGEPLKGVRAVTWQVSVRDHIATATVEFLNVQVDLIGDVGDAT